MKKPNKRRPDRKRYPNFAAVIRQRALFAAMWDRIGDSVVYGTVLDK